MLHIFFPMKTNHTASSFAQSNLQMLRKQFAKSGITMPQFDDRTAALAVAIFAKVGGEQTMLRIAKVAMTELARA